MGRNIVSRKMQFGWVQTHIPFSVVSGPKFTRLFTLNAGGIADHHIAFRFWISCLVPKIFAIEVSKLSEISANFACFWPPISLGGGPPEFLDLHYKIHPHFDHVAKFRGDRPTELGDLVAREKQTSAVKHKAFRTNVRAA